MDRTRRGLLAALLGVGSGCLGFGSNNEVTPVSVDTTAPRTPTPTATTTATATATESPTPAATSTTTDSPTPTATPTETDSPTPTATPTETDSPTPTPTPTPRGAQAPPPGSLAVELQSYNVRFSSGGPLCDVAISVQNRGDVVFTVVDLRVEVRYDPIGGDRFLAGVGYVRQRFDGLGSGDGEQLAETFELTESRIDGREPEDQFELALQYRGVEYLEP